MKQTHMSLLLVALVFGCASAPTTRTTDTASTAGSESESSGQPGRRPRSSGDWTVGGQPFTPESGVAVHRDDGSYDVLIASPAVDCEFARHGGTPPEHLRTIRINLPWRAGVAVQSSSSDTSGQVLFVYDGPSPFDPSHIMSQNTVVDGTVTPSEAPSGPGATGTIQLAVDGPDPQLDKVHGEIDVTLCD